MRETLHLVTADGLSPRCGGDGPVLPHLRAQYLPDGVDMERVVELASHAAAALGEPLEGVALRPILAELETEIADDRVWRRVRTNAAILHVPGDELHAFGPRNRFVSAAAWLGAIEAEEADGLTRLVRRYLAAYGPSTRADIAAWTGLAVSTIAPALETLEPELERLEDARGRELVDLRGAPRPPGDTPAPLRLLGEWDNVLLAHADRTRVFDDETRRRVIRKNGDVMPTILVDGFVAGTWWWKRRKDVGDAGGDAVREADEARESRAGATEAEVALRVLEPAASRFEVELVLA